MVSMPTLSQFIASGKVLLLDGATGSRLIASGLQPGCCPELWNIEQPDKVKNVASTYFEAGSDTVLTNTFGGSLLKLRDYGLEGRANELNEAAAELSRAGALAVGSNCGNGLEKMINVGKEFRSLSKDLHILIKSNAGEPAYTDRCTIYPEDSGFLEAHADELFSFRPSVLGGCCGTDPEYIRCLRRLIDERSRVG